MADSQVAPVGVSSELQSRPAHPVRTSTNPLPGQLPVSVAVPPPHGPQSHNPSTYGSPPQGYPAHGPASHDHPRRASMTEGNRSYQSQDIELKDGSKCLPQNYDQPPKVHHYDHVAYRSDSYGSDNRDRYDRSSAKERSGFAFEQGAELVRSIGKLTKMKLQQGYGEASDSLSGKARKSRHGHGNVDHLKVARDYYREEFEKLKRKVSYFEDQNRDLEDQNRDLEDALRIEQDNVERVRRSANQMQSTMDNRESFLGDQENDNVVETTFLHLMTDIKNWSGRFGGGNAHSLKGEKLQDYQKVFPFCDDFHALENAVAHPKKSRLFVRGWTAYVMCTKLLRSLDLPPVGVVGEDVWIGNTLADSFHCLENRLWFADRNVVSYKSFNDWRAFTAELLGKAVSIPDDNPTDEARTLVGVAVADVMDVATAWLKNPADLEATEDALYSIFFRAVQFSRVLRRQRALWSVRFPLGSNRGEPGRLRFEPGFMKNYRVEDEDDVEELKSRFVEHIVTPALYKRGTMNGEKFDCEEAIFEAEVGLA